MVVNKNRATHPRKQPTSTSDIFDAILRGDSAGARLGEDRLPDVRRQRDQVRLALAKWSKTALVEMTAQSGALGWAQTRTMTTAGIRAALYPGAGDRWQLASDMSRSSSRSAPATSRKRPRGLLCRDESRIHSPHGGSIWSSRAGAIR